MLLNALFLASVSHAQPAPKRVLMLGNSYTQFNDLQFRVAEAVDSTVPGLAGIEGARRTAGGLRLPDHVDRAEGTDDRWVDSLTGEAGRWHWLVLQDQSQIAGFPESEALWMDSAAAVPTLDGFAVEQEATTVLFMTWGRRDGDLSNPSMYPDFETMNARLDAGYRSYAERPSVEGRAIYIAPVGRAFGVVYDRLEAAGVTPEDEGTEFHRLYDGDGSHPSPLGSALAAGVFVRTLTGWTLSWAVPPSGVGEADLVWLAEAAEASVVPFEDLRYPWAFALSDWLPPADLEEVAGARTISGLETCPTLLVDSAVSETHWHLGASHEGVPGCGRLWVSDGGVLTSDVLSLAETAGARGELVVVGGSVASGSTVLGRDAAVGDVRVTGGEVDLGVVHATQGRIRVEGGAVRLSGGSTGGTIDLVDGSLEIYLAADSVALSDASALAGTLIVNGLGDVEVDVLTAPGLTLDPDLAVEVPDGWSWALVDASAGQAVRLSPDSTEGGGSGSDGDGAGEGGESDEATPTDSGVPSDADGAGNIGSSDKAGCGCAATSSSGAWGGWAVGLGLLLWGRRRRT